MREEQLEIWGSRRTLYQGWFTMLNYFEDEKIHASPKIQKVIGYRRVKLCNVATGKRGRVAATAKDDTPSSVTSRAASNTPDESVAASDRNTPASKAESDAKDDSSSNGDRKEIEGAPTPKPPSAGASIRESANKILALATKGEWTPVEQELKKLEKYVANQGEDGNTMPLAGIHDMVRF
ncbi:hypothetical protein EVAR_101566_1 [Eumeta japonica]|uniref:Uncharacterized protein n=1 Tax=Eumeta variegata TaxID=151549 RepID=A0A4C1SR74_EUMVA|nr:hypothetical protein EVAR_101566_1 [Eumeta japonica]